jgi:hypothetical protein
MRATGTWPFILALDPRILENIKQVLCNSLWIAQQAE